jgi:ElaB/YqjD/DUF883 family membrane-anchored ribosome-binding protein
MEQPISPERVVVARTPPERVIFVRRPSDIVRDQFSQLNRRLEAFIAENPAISLGIALTFGVVLGWLIKRR